jgi:hypothetical protein
MINKIYIPGKLAIKLDGNRYFKPDDMSVLQKYLEEIMNGDPEVQVELNIVKIDGKKSLQQLRYFYGVMLPVIKQALEDLQGESLTKEEVIMFLKGKYFYEEVAMGGEFVKLPMSFSKATREDVAKFIHNVLQFANEVLGAHIPEPD